MALTIHQLFIQTCNIRISLIESAELSVRLQKSCILSVISANINVFSELIKMLAWRKF